MTVFRLEDDVGVCSRNKRLPPEHGGNFWAVVEKLQLTQKLASIAGRNLAVQGELVGPDVQGNKYKLRTHAYYCYDIFDIDAQSYISPAEVRHLCATVLEIPMCPVLIEERPLTEADTVDSLLALAEGVSALAAVEREGIVFKSVGSPGTSFKAISNKFLLKYDD